MELVLVAVEMIYRFHRSARTAADADPVFWRRWDAGIKDRLPRAEAWIRRPAPAIADRITG